MADLVRDTLEIRRTHQRFQLKQLEFAQQFASMYFVRLSALRPRAELIHTNIIGKSVPSARVLSLEVGKKAVCIGTLFKTMKNARRFLDEYQKELVRIDAGDDDDDGDAMQVEDTHSGPQKNFLEREATERAAGRGGRPTCITSTSDVLILEDESGRVELATEETNNYVTGVVVVVVGTLEAKGKLKVEAMYPCGAAAQKPRAMPAPGLNPNYLAFVSGFCIGSAGQSASSLDLLVDYLCGNVGSEATQRQSSRIGRLVVGGNSIDITEEWRLKAKVKLDPADHAKESTSENTTAKSMKELDSVLLQLAEVMDLDVMPGETDPSNSFWPQQPIHPVMLGQSSRKSTVRVVTNPYEFEIPSDDGASVLQVFATSGQNVDDMLRQRDGTPLEVMASIVESGCTCPTAPNSLVCYPFKDSDPFVFPTTPHIFVSCNQESFTTMMFETANGASVRLVTVPSFSSSPEIVLVDVNSPELATTSVRFA